MKIDARNDKIGTSLTDTIAGWAVALTFVFLFVLPVILTACYRTSADSYIGRAGFLIPAVIMADSENRYILGLSLAGSVSVMAVAWILGPMLGFLSISCRSRTARAIRFAVFLPGKGPAWLFPVLFSVGSTNRTDELFFGSATLLLWVGWVAWWGASRFGQAFLESARSITQSEWEAAICLGGGNWSSIWTILAPRLRAIYLRESRAVAAVCLFDPTPVLFWGLDDWPIARAVRSARYSDGQGLPESAGWFLWMAMVLAISSGIARVAFSRGVAEGTDRFADRANRVMIVPSGVGSPQFRSLILLGLWPWMLLIWVLSGIRGINKEFDGLIAKLAAVPARGESSDSLVFGCLIVIVAFFGIVLTRNFVDVRRLSRFCVGPVLRWPLSAAVCGLLIRSGSSSSVGTAIEESVFGTYGCGLWPIALATFGFAEFASMRVRNGSDRPVAEIDAAFEAALTSGMSLSKAKRLSGKSSHRRLSVKEAAAVGLSFWWIWAAPAWAAAPLLGFSTVPLWGQLLVSEFKASPDHNGFLGIVLFTLIPLGIFVFLTILVEFARIIGHSRRKVSLAQIVERA